MEALLGILPCMFLCFLYMIPIVLGITALIIWIMTIIEVVKKEPESDENRLMWLLIVLLTGIIGAIIYIVVRRPERRRRYGW